MIVKVLQVFFLTLILNGTVVAATATDILDHPIGSWTFSGVVKTESGERYGYFFQIHKDNQQIQASTALIDGQSKQLIFSYEDSTTLKAADTIMDWQVGRAFVHYNPINDSWIFGVKTKDKKGFRFKADLLGQQEKSRLILKPGIELQTLQTSRLNGHIRTGEDSKEQFVTGNKDWFATLWFTSKPRKDHKINTAFCRLSNENGFYSASLKESDATDASVARWRDASGNLVNMSQFISIQSLADNICRIRVKFPKLQLTLLNTLDKQAESSFLVAGFSKENPSDFCFLTGQSFLKA